jgi:hypothetical protein
MGNKIRSASWWFLGFGAVLLAFGLHFAEVAHKRADEIMSLLTSKEFDLLFSFAYAGICGALLISVSLSFLLSAVVLRICENARSAGLCGQERQSLGATGEASDA